MKCFNTWPCHVPGEERVIQVACQESGVGSMQVDVVSRRLSGFRTQHVECAWTLKEAIWLIPGLSFLCAVEGKGYGVST